MKIINIALFALVLLVSGFAYSKDTYVKGYTRNDGTYVQPHYRSKSDGNPHNNYSTQGNVNPYTGKKGTVNPYSQGYKPSSYDSDSNSEESE